MPGKRETYHHGDLRNALVAAARDLLAEQGVAALDLRKVARRVGVSHAAPYRHFADKEALLAAVAEAGFAELTLRARAELAASSHNEAPAQLRALVRAYVGFALNHQHHVRLMFGGLARDAAKYPQLLNASKEPLYLAAGVIADCQERGQLISGDPMELTVVAWSAMHGLAMLLIDQLLPDEGAPADQLIDLLTGHLYAGLQPR